MTDLATTPLQAVSSSDIEKNKDVAAFSYVPFMSFIVYALKRESAFVRFHSRQGIVLTILAIAFFFIPYASKVLEMAVLIGIAAGFLGAAQGQWYNVPFAGSLSQGHVILAFRELWPAFRHLLQNARSLWNNRYASKNHATSAPMTTHTSPSKGSPLQEQEEAHFGIEKSAILPQP